MALHDIFPFLPTPEASPARQQSAGRQIVDTRSPAGQILRQVKGAQIMSYPAVWRAVLIISENISAMPPVVIQKFPKGKQRRSDRRWPVLERPNPQMSWAVFTRHCLQRLLEDGQSVSHIQRSGNHVTRLTPLPPAKRERKNGAVTYEVDGETFSEDEIMDCVWVREKDGLTPKDPKVVLTQAFALVGAGQFLSLKTLLSGGLPLLAATISATATTDQLDRAREQLTEHLNTYYQKMTGRGATGDNVLVMPAGVELDAVGQSLKDLEFAEVGKALREIVGLIFGVPAAWLDVQRPQSAQAENQSLRLYAALHPYVVLFQEALSHAIWPKRGHIVALDPSGTFKSSFKELLDTLGTGVQRGIYTPNEARIRADLDTFDEEWADTLYLQAQMIAMQAAFEGQANPVNSQNGNGDSDE